MSEELALPTKESIRSAAEKCPEAKEVLEELFPKVFEKEKKYCCSAFGRAIGEKDICDDGAHFIFGNNWLVSFCPFCGTEIKKRVSKE